MKKIRYIALILSLLLICFAFSGCGKEEAKTEKGNTLTFSWSKDIGDLNPHLYGINQMFAQAMVYEPLVKYGENGKIEPCLAESWEISPDGKEYTFKLRQGVKFSDGSNFDAKAVKMNFDAVLANKTRHAWLELINQIKDTQVVDDHTFKIVFQNAYYPALQELALIRPLRMLAPAGFPDDGNTANSIKKPIGTGPWVLSEYKKDQYAVFVRNENYWGPKPKLEKVTVKVIPDSEATVLALEKGEIDLIYGSGLISLDAFKQIKDAGTYETGLSGPNSTRVLAINSNKGPTKDLKVRQALAYGVDKAAIVEGIFYGTEEKADTLFAASFPYCNLNLKPYSYDSTKAAALLDEAGWKLPAGKEFRAKDGKTLELDLCFTSTDTTQKAIAELIQGEMKKIGVKLNIIGEEEQAFSDRQKNGNFHLIFNETWGVPYDPHSFISSMRQPSHADYQAQLGLPMKGEIDKKIGEVLVSTDESSRKQLYSYILGTLHEQAVYLPISHTKNLAVYNKKVGGVKFLSSSYEIPLEAMEIK